MPDAFIHLLNTGIKGIAHQDGTYLLSDVPAGKYILEAEFVGFHTIDKTISVGDHQVLEVDLALERNGALLHDVHVFGKLNQEEESTARSSEKKNSNITNIISAKAMERSPDINAANVLQRMSGVTLQKNSGSDEAYAIVRGLEPRYNNTLINGIKIASPDEKSRFISLNVVPSDLLQKIEISKSLLPEMEGDAIGGTVNLVMKDAPDVRTFKALGSVGYSALFFNRKFVSFPKSDIQQQSLHERNGSSYVAVPGDFSRSNLDFSQVQPVPTGVAGIVWGRRFLDKKFGVLIAENFQDQYYGTNSQFNQVAPDANLGIPAISDVSNRSFSTRQLNNGVTVHLDYNLNEKNKFTLSNILLYSYLAQSRVSIDTAFTGGNGGRTVPGTGPVTTDYTSITSRQLIENAKLEGKHVLSPHLLFDWAGVFSDATKRSPDRADLAINKKIDTTHTTLDPKGPYDFKSTPQYFDNISRIWQHNSDKDYNAIANLTYRSDLQKGNSVELKTGGLYRHKNRYNLQDEYLLRPTTVGSGMKQEYTGIETAQWTVYDTKGTADYDVNNYRLYENIYSGYLQGKYFSQKVDIAGGVRMEKTAQGFTLNTFYATGINGVDKNFTDVLPSVMAKMKLTPKINLRLSYFKSISRPNYYELVPTTLLSSSNATSEQGNPYLKHSIADNFDVRYEFFPKEEDQLFLGAFYKKIHDPIEYAYVDGTTYKPQNFGTATVYGGELVYTKYFGNLGLTGNYTYIYSAIRSNKSYTDLTTRTTYDKLQKRPMQGQTNHTVNLSVLYKNSKAGAFAQLSYEYLGKTLALVYPVFGFDYYRQPQSFLALSAEKQLHNRHFTAFGKFNNLLNTPTYNKINELVTVKDIYKSSFSIGLRYSHS